MGNADSQQASLKELQANYTTVKTINDPRYGEAKLLASKSSKEEFLLKEINMTDEAQFKKWQLKLQQRIQNPNPYLINLLKMYYQEDNQFCGRFFKVQLIFDYIGPTLANLISQHKLQNLPFSENEIWTLLYGSVEGLSRLQQLHVSHQSIRPETISVRLEDRFAKISEPTLFNSVTNFQLAVSDFNNNLSNIYLSPQLVQNLQKGIFQPKHNPFKSDVFSLGMCLLQAALLESCDSCYRYEQYKFIETELEHKLAQLTPLYTPELCQTLKEMLVIDEETRPDFVQLKQELSSFQKENFFSYHPQISHHQSQLQDSQISSQRKFESFTQSKPIVVHQANLQASIQSKPSLQSTQKSPILEVNLRQSAATTYPIRPDDGDNLNYIKLPSDQPSKTPVPDSNVGNELGKNDFEEQRQDSPEQEKVKHLTGASIFPVTQFQEHTYTRTQQGYDPPKSYESYKFSNDTPSQGFDIHKDIQRIKDSYQIEFDKLKRAQDPIQLHSQNYDIKHISTLNTSSQNQVQNYEYLYDRNLNTGEKISQYQGDLAKKFKIENENDDYNKKSNYLVKENVIETYSNGSKYEGEKLNGMRHGKGKFFYADGGLYDGQWFENKMHGTGTLFYSSGKPAYEGQWVDDQFEGKGILYNEHPVQLKYEFDPTDFDQIGDHWTKYQGGFHEDNKEGLGTMFLSNGERFEGYFLADLVSGPGKFLQRNGEVMEGHWWNNKLQY